MPRYKRKSLNQRARERKLQYRQETDNVACVPTTMSSAFEEEDDNADNISHTANEIDQLVIRAVEEWEVFNEDFDDPPSYDTVFDNDGPNINENGIQLPRYGISLSPDAVCAIKKFDSACTSIVWRDCGNCNTRFPDLKITKGKCASCNRHPFRWTARNNMDPGVVPPELIGLTPIECMLIARVNPVITIFRHLGNQHKYRGNVINFPQNIEEYTTVLPHLPADLPYILIFHRSATPADITFTARADKVRAALYWLKRNNKWYHDIDINENNLSSLPGDGNITSMLRNITVDDDTETDADCDGDYNAFIPNLRNIDSAETVKTKLHSKYPSMQPNPINEYLKNGYIAQAFPTLFPYGSGDYNDYRIDDKFTLTEYSQFLMRYKDQRFAKDERLKYLLLNTIFRHQLISQANVYIRKGHWRDQQVQAFQMAAENNPHIFKNMMAFNKNLKCCSAFWKHKTRQLRAMCDQIGRPGFFFTLSAADYYWPDLYAVLVPGVDFKTLDLTTRRRLMHDNPLIVSYYVQRRVLLFLKHVIVPVFNVVDHWCRFEWQARGSTHAHGILWMENAPIFDENNFTEDELENIVTYFRCMVLAINPIDERGDTHPCELRFSDVPSDNHELDLAHLINSVQRHTKCSQYCLRRDRITRVIKCRFNFPQPLRDECGVDNEAGYIRFEAQRDDPLCQRWSPVILTGWRANHDMTPILSLTAVIAYVAKYVSKEEKSSRSYQHILRDMCNGAAEDGNLNSLLFSMFIKTMGERDISAQEVCHLLMGWPLVETTRSFVNLTLFEEEWEQLDTRGGMITVVGKSYIDKYRQRPAKYNAMSLELFAKKVNVRGNTYVNNKNDNVLLVMPTIKRTFTEEDNENYFRQQCILKIPFRGPFDDILRNNISTSIRTWCDLYANRRLEGVHVDDARYSDDDSGDELPVVDEGVRQNIFEINCGIGVNVNDDAPLGLRLMDVTHNWSAHDNNLPTLAEVQAFLTTYKNTNIVTQYQDTPQITYSNEQRAILEQLDVQITYVNGQSNDDGMLIRRQVVQGKAGSGKSTLIHAMVDRIRTTLGAEYVSVCAPTGAAAVNINGNTLHSEFKLPYQRSQFQSLAGEQLSKFQNEKRNLHFVIIDEMSMVGSNTLYQLQKRMADLRPNATDSFGGLFIYMFGDFRQLPPVLDTPLYETTSPHECGTLGLACFKQFQSFVELQTGHRQRDPTFARLVDKIALGRLSEQDYHKLAKRNRQAFNANDLDMFNNAVHLCATNKDVDIVNNKCLARTEHPVALLQAIHEPNVALSASEDMARGLISKLVLSIGCRVMLRDNLWVKGGLVNGSLGTVRAIVYDTGVSPPSLPMYILVEFDKYQGPCIKDRLFPIVTKDVTWKVHNHTHMRRQFPLILAHACTIHKAQGLTIDKMILDIGKKDFACGLSYVGITRVRCLEDLLFEPFFSYDRLAKLHTGPTYATRQKFFRWLHGLSK